MTERKRPCVKLAALIDEKFRTRHDFCVKANIVDPVLSRYLADFDACGIVCARGTVR